jgi:hypothetical protein
VRARSKAAPANCSSRWIAGVRSDVVVQYASRFARSISASDAVASRRSRASYSRPASAHARLSLSDESLVSLR